MSDTGSSVKVSVIVTNYNLAEYLPEAIESVLAQTFDDFEIIIIDDASTLPNNKSVLEEIGKSDQRISVYFLEDNIGLSAARNYGIKKSKGEFILNLDADDRIDSHFLEKTIGLLVDNPKVAIASSWMKTFGESTSYIQTPEYDVSKLLATNVLPIGSLYRKSAAEEVGLYDESFESYEDWDFWLRIVKAGYIWEVIREYLFFYRIRKGSMLGNVKNDLRKTLALTYRIFDKHKEFYQQHYLEVIKKQEENFRWTWYELEKQKLHQNIEQRVQNEIYEKHKTALESLDWKINQVEGELFIVRLDRLFNKVKGLFFMENSPVKRILKKLILPVLAYRAYRKTRDTIRNFRHRYKKYPVVQLQEKLADENVVVSVIIPCYNYGRFLPDALWSIHEQTWKRLEVIVVDDGSTDEKTKQVLEDLEKNAKDYPHPLTIIRKENAGIVSARNFGISKARGKYIVCLDADDMLEKTYIEKAVWALELNSEIGVVYSFMKMFGKSDDVYEFGQFTLDALKEWNQVHTAAVFRRICWEQVGGYKEEMKDGHEDWEFWISIAEKGWEGFRIREALFFYRVHSSESLGNKAMLITTNLENRIRQLHLDLYAGVNFKLKNPGKFFKPKFDFTKFNPDQKTKTKAIIFFTAYIIGGGAERLWTNIASELKKRGYQLLIMSFEDFPHTLYQEMYENTLGMINLPKFAPKSEWRNFIKSQYEKYDVAATILSSGQFAYDNLEFIKSLSSAPVIDAIYNDSDHGFIKFSARDDALIDKHLVNNPAIINTYVEKYKVSADKIFYMPSCIDLDYFKASLDKAELRERYKLPKNDFIFTYIGRLSWEKNIDHLILGLDDLIINHPILKNKVKLIIAGDGPQHDELVKLTKDLGIESQVIYYPFLQDPRKIYGVSDCFCLVSSFDGFPLTILESLALNIPILATDVGAKKEVLVHGKNSYMIAKSDRFLVSKAMNEIAFGKFFENTDKHFRETVLPYDRAKITEVLMEKINLPKLDPQ